MEILTPRLHLRPHTADDVSALREVYADPAVREHLGGDRLLDPEVVQEQIDRFLAQHIARGDTMCAAIDRQTGRYLGRIGLLWWPEWQELEVGWTLRREVWGRGLATEGGAACVSWAFMTKPDLDALSCVVSPGNVPSLAVARTLGLVREREDVVVRGTDRFDVIVHRLARADWERRRSLPPYVVAGAAAASGV